jgi:DEAD/DEAH box helicase domain-containing protein
LPPTPRPAWQAELFGNAPAPAADAAEGPPRRAPLSSEAVSAQLKGVLSRWQGERRTAALFTATETTPAEAAQHAAWPERLEPRVVAALKSRGIGRLYRHQAQAIAAALDGQHVVVATPTASGKSPTYNAPVLDALCRSGDAHALYLFPTKALARDQEAELGALTTALLGSRGQPKAGLVGVYDGDTPGDERRLLRDRARILVTNPDMLHRGLLPGHDRFARLFAGLTHVVVDELHTYRGVFGSHVAHVLRRLQRLCAFHGSRPTFLMSSATIGNPRELAARLIGVEPGQVALFDRSGAPAGTRHTLLCNPPVIDAQTGRRQNHLVAARRLARELLLAEVPTLVFAHSRKQVELLLGYLREDLVAAGQPPELIMGYRGGYLPELRRQIERGLREGQLLGVVATSALELGVDIGHLSAVVIAGYPGTISSTRQQAGRAGRRGAPSVAAVVATGSPLDQYLAQHPEELLGRPAEQALVDPENVEILLAHLKCAAYELPFVESPGQPATYGHLDAEDTAAALDHLARAGLVRRSATRTQWIAEAFPAELVHLRGSTLENFVVTVEPEGRTLAEVDRVSAPLELHQNAIYQHDGETYEVLRLDFQSHRAYVKPVEIDYYTTAETRTEVEVIEELGQRALALEGTVAGWGEVAITERVIGFKKVRFHTGENLGYGEVHLPDHRMQSMALWLALPPSTAARLELPDATLRDGAEGLLHAVHHMGALLTMSDPRDLGHTLGQPEAGTALTLYLFERSPGGVGLCRRLHEELDGLLARTRALLSGCACEAGCPSCVGAVAQVEMAVGRRQAALRLVEALCR